MPTEFARFSTVLTTNISLFHRRSLDHALEQKKATDKQIAYIAGLLDKLGLTLEESYHKSDYDDLTRLDARNLIDALTTSLEPHEDEDEMAQTPD